MKKGTKLIWSIISLYGMLVIISLSTHYFSPKEKKGLPSYISKQTSVGVDDDFSPVTNPTGFVRSNSFVKREYSRNRGYASSVDKGDIFSYNYSSRKNKNETSHNIYDNGVLGGFSGNSSHLRYNNQEKGQLHAWQARRFTSFNELQKTSIFASSQSLLTKNLVDVGDHNAGDITHPSGEPLAGCIVPVGDGIYILMLALGIYLFIKRRLKTTYNP